MKIIFLTLFTTALISGIAPDRIEFEAPECYPEGIAFCPKNDCYYVSSARLGTIGEVTSDGKYKAFYQSADLKSSYGLKISPDQKRLFACIGDANYSKYQSSDTHKKMARLIAIDLKSGKKTFDVDLSNLVAGKHFPNDLTFDKSGNVYVTDSFANVIYKVASDGKASVFSKSDLFKTEGVGLNGIAYNPGNFLLVSDSGTGMVYKVDVANPNNVQPVKIPQFFMNADGLLLTDPNTLTLVQNGGSNRVYQLSSSDNWKTARVISATALEDRFAFPSTATANKGDVWVMNAKFNELADSTNVPSKKFTIQKAIFRPMK